MRPGSRRRRRAANEEDTCVYERVGFFAAPLGCRGLPVYFETDPVETRVMPSADRA